MDKILLETKVIATILLTFFSWVVRKIFLIEQYQAVNNTEDKSRDKQIETMQLEIRSLGEKVDKVLGVVSEQKDILMKILEKE
jgi:hypothetical protein